MTVPQSDQPHRIVRSLGTDGADIEVILDDAVRELRGPGLRQQGGGGVTRERGAEIVTKFQQRAIAGVPLREPRCFQTVADVEAARADYRRELQRRCAGDDR